MVRVRTAREIGLIAKSCQIVADTLDMLTSYVKPGADLLKLDRRTQLKKITHKSSSE